jgi:hypothetical protein
MHEETNHMMTQSFAVTILKVCRGMQQFSCQLSALSFQPNAFSARPLDCAWNARLTAES